MVDIARPTKTEIEDKLTKRVVFDSFINTYTYRINGKQMKWSVCRPTIIHALRAENLFIQRLIHLKFNLRTSACFLWLCSMLLGFLLYYTAISTNVLQFRNPNLGSWQSRDIGTENQAGIPRFGIAIPTRLALQLPQSLYYLNTEFDQSCMVDGAGLQQSSGMYWVR